MLRPAVTSVICPDGSAPYGQGNPVGQISYLCLTYYNSLASCPPSYVPVPALPGKCVISPTCAPGSGLLVHSGQAWCAQMCPSGQLPLTVAYGGSTYVYCSSSPGEGAGARACVLQLQGASARS